MSQITKNIFSSGPMGFVQTLTSNSGGAVGPDGANNINVVGSGNITGAGNGGTNTITFTLTGTTNHALQVGNSAGSLTSLGVAGNGQIPIGSAGVDPVIANITAGSGISISNGPGTITISATGADLLAYTNVNTTPYVVLTTDEYLGVDCSGGAITIQLPNAPSTGRVFYIKDRTGSANTNNISVTTVGGAVNIDGVTTYTMNTQYASINVLFDGSTYQIF